MGYKGTWHLLIYLFVYLSAFLSALSTDIIILLSLLVLFAHQQVSKELFQESDSLDG